MQSVAALLFSKYHQYTIILCVITGMDRHTITEVNSTNRTGVCKVCGLVKLRKRARGEIITWSCGVVEKAAKKRWLQTPKGKISNKQSDWKKRNGFKLPAEAIAKYKAATHCECCGEPRSYIKPNDFVIDHCHDTGAIRGNICNRCNLSLGMFNSIELLKKAIEYLTRGTQSAISN